ncbi:hypothetical protein NUW54_g10231 [Trametes sanguinea]|uniref:Uncharacterized protein n=1 Tax=Trametes sanguinea TaxID=158606 RepID=A0ACC1P0I2_9APHY|nr:hypothetical protein NUW54_g10231 [Trametes sanguinea]
MDFYAQEHAADLATHERVLTAEELTTMGDPPVFKYVRASFAHSLASSWPRYRLEVPCEGGVRTFLVCRPMFFANGMAGRGTRGYVAVDCQTGRFVWLKDAWRVYYDKLEQEGTVLGMLNAKGIAHVPTLLCHGDIRQQTTQTSDFWEKENARAALKTTELNQPIRSLHPSLLSSSSTLVAPPHFETSSSRKRSRTQVEGESPGSADEDTLRRHMHYRLVVNEVALPLSHFSSGRKLVLIVIDCIKAHRDAVEKAEIMHRDVSGGNILIYPHVEQGKTKHRVRWGGLLADWEMSKSTKVEELQSPPRQPPRTGTWQFLSVAMLSGRAKAVETPDELESFLHVLLYHAVRYLRSNCPDPAEFIESYFDAYTHQGEDYTCGQRKVFTIKHGVLEYGPGMPLKFGSPLDTVFGGLLQWFKANYKVMTYQWVQEDAAKRLPPLTIPEVTAKPEGSDDSDDASDDEDPEDANLIAFATPRLQIPQLEYSLKPSPAEEQDAALLHNHAGMLGVLLQARVSKQWDSGDKVGDRVPDDYVPRFPIAPEKGPSTRTVKRRRIESTMLYKRCHSIDVPQTRRTAKSMFK